MKFNEIVNELKNVGIEEVFWLVRSGFSKDELEKLKLMLEMELLEFKHYDGIEF